MWWTQCGLHALRGGKRRCRIGPWPTRLQTGKRYKRQSRAELSSPARPATSLRASRPSPVSMTRGRKPSCCARLPGTSPRRSCSTNWSPGWERTRRRRPSNMRPTGRRSGTSPRTARARIGRTGTSSTSKSSSGGRYPLKPSRRWSRTSKRTGPGTVSRARLHAVARRPQPGAHRHHGLRPPRRTLELSTDRVEDRLSALWSRRPARSVFSWAPLAPYRS